MVEFSYIEVFFAIVAVYAIAFACGWFSREQAAVHKVNKMFAEIDKKTNQLEQENRILCQLEIHHGHFYMFDKETGKFYGQGETTKELSNVLREQHPDKTFILPNEDADILGIK